MALSTSSRKVSVEQLWNCYALEDEDQRKKLWLDLFLCRAIKEDVDPFMCGHVSRTRIVPHLIAELKNEIGLFCRPSLAANDLEQLKRYEVWTSISLEKLSLLFTFYLTDFNFTRKIVTFVYINLTDFNFTRKIVMSL